MNNYIHVKQWVITHPYPNFNGGLMNYRAWSCNDISQEMMHAVTYPCLTFGQSMLVKEVPVYMQNKNIENWDSLWCQFFQQCLATAFHNFGAMFFFKLFTRYSARIWILLEQIMKWNKISTHFSRDNTRAVALPASCKDDRGVLSLHIHSIHM